MTPKRVLCVGRTYVDLVFQSDDLPDWGTEIYATGFGCLTGGGAFITAAYLSAQGCSVRLAGSAGGAEPFGGIITRDLARCDIDGTLLTRGADAQVTVAISGRDDRAFLTHRDKTPIQVPYATEFDHLHIGELSTLIDCPALIDLARACGATISSDCADEDDYPAGCADLISRLDVFLPSEVELATLQEAGIDLSAHPHLVVKRGVRGASARIGGAWHETGAVPTVVVDPTGAGDAFNAGYLHGWLIGAPVDQCLARGARCGAAAVSAIGGWVGRATIA